MHELIFINICNIIYSNNLFIKYLLKNKKSTLLKLKIYHMLTTVYVIRQNVHHK